ncbi:MAG: hypothetical protein HDR88_17665 [Bacteroides sp.]|nr:hypothetical protein [Bacteroides sp.]
MRNFKIEFTHSDFTLLKQRINEIRLPNFQQAEGWEMGTPVNVLKKVLKAWADSYEMWKVQENYLNQFPQFIYNIYNIDGVNIHFFPYQIIKSGCHSDFDGTWVV